MKNKYDKFEETMRDLFSNKNTAKNSFSGRFLLMELDKNRLVSIKLTTSRTMDNYTGVDVEITHKQNGSLKQQRFLFADHFNEGSNYIWNNQGIHWYNGTPSTASVKKFQDAIDKWIGLWK